MALHPNSRAGWRRLTVIAVKQALCRGTLRVALPVVEEKPAAGVGGAALPGVQDPQRAVPSIPVPSRAAAASVTGPVAPSALTPLCSGALAPGPRGAGGAGAPEAWAPRRGGLRAAAVVEARRRRAAAWNGRGQAVGAPVALEAGTVGWEARLGGGQTQPTVVAVMGATGGGSLAAGGPFKTLQRGGERVRDLV